MHELRCNACYTTNTNWATICQKCGEPVEPIRLCSKGHVLPPGSSECPRCPHAWPDIPAFRGPPILRGVALIVGGALRAEDGTKVLEHIEVRDSALPYSIVSDEHGQARLIPHDDPNALAKLLMRPEGLLACVRGGPRGDGPPQSYETVANDGIVRAGGVSLRVVAFTVPNSLLSEVG